MILILTNAEDRSADLVEGELRRTGTDFLRLNTERFGTDSQIDFRVRHSSPEVIFKTSSINVPGEKISSIWNRRLIAPIPPEQIVNKEAREFAACELGSLLNGALLTLNCVWVSHPSAIRTSSYKINQLNAAADEGFRLPETCVSMDTLCVKKFYRSLQQNQKRLIAKLVSQGPPRAETPDQQYSVYTNLLNKNDIVESSVAGCPAIYQEYIEKKIELRVTVVGERVFACEIQSQATEKTRIDWRRYDFPYTPYLPHKLHAETEAKCIALTKRFGLLFSAIDLIIHPDGGAVFLELNPNGQWGWVEELTGLPISAAIADLLRKSGTP